MKDIFDELPLLPLFEHAKPDASEEEKKELNREFFGFIMVWWEIAERIAREELEENRILSRDKSDVFDSVGDNKNEV